MSDTTTSEVSGVLDSDGCSISDLTEHVQSFTDRIERGFLVNSP
jgi:hypothetical protein